MSLTELVQLLKKSYGYILALIVLATLSVAIYIYVDNPRGEQGFGNLPKPEIKSSLDDKVSVTSTLDFSSDPPRLVDVYKGGEVLATKTLTNKLEVTGDPQTIKGGLYWTGVVKSLSVNDSSFTFDV